MAKPRTGNVLFFLQPTVVPGTLAVVRERGKGGVLYCAPSRISIWVSGVWRACLFPAGCSLLVVRSQAAVQHSPGSFSPLVSQPLSSLLLGQPLSCLLLQSILCQLTFSKDLSQLPHCLLYPTAHWRNQAPSTICIPPPHLVISL